MPIVSGGGGGVSLPLNLGPGLFTVDAHGLVVSSPNISAVPVQFKIKAGPGSKADGDEVFAVYDDLNTEIFGVDAIGGTLINLASSPFSGMFGISVDGGANIVSAVATGASTLSALRSASGFATTVIAGGALPTQQFVSGAGAGLSTGRDVQAHTPVTFNPQVAATATCAVALSADGVTYSTLTVWTEPVGAAFAGTIHDVVANVPAGWLLKMTAVNAVLGLTTYY